MELRLSRRTVDEIDGHALDTYPEECCGAVLGAAEGERARRITNIQGRLHAEDPEKHPRDARIAYFMDPKELYAVLRDGERQETALRVFYHSHPEHGAYFSDEDKARAMAWDEPAYPDAAYVVISVYGREVKDRRAYAWDPDRRDFVEVPLRVSEP
jgi:[CysO sulfur-carrier protein]-S-L-cysteine hydrolase